VRGVRVGAERLPLLFAVAIYALVVIAFGMVFQGALDQAPEGTYPRLAVVDGYAVRRLLPVWASESEVQLRFRLAGHPDFLPLW